MRLPSVFLRSLLAVCGVSTKQRPLWAFVVYGGYVMQMMTARVAAEALWEGYKRLERKVKAILTDWETNLVEQSLTVNSEPQS